MGWTRLAPLSYSLSGKQHRGGQYSSPKQVAASGSTFSAAVQTADPITSMCLSRELAIWAGTDLEGLSRCSFTPRHNQLCLNHS